MENLSTIITVVAIVLTGIYFLLKGQNMLSKEITQKILSKIDMIFALLVFVLLIIFFVYLYHENRG
jgi:membrane-anchored glycerophosphoryl diester phosphodiesterase (GDPDase)